MTIGGGCGYETQDSKLYAERVSSTKNCNSLGLKDESHNM